jgi:hypothetical protein
LVHGAIIGACITTHVNQSARIQSSLPSKHRYCHHSKVRNREVEADKEMENMIKEEPWVIRRMTSSKRNRADK